MRFTYDTRMQAQIAALTGKLSGYTQHSVRAPRVMATPPTVTMSATRTLEMPIYAASGGGGPNIASQSAGSPWSVSRTLPANPTTGGIAFQPQPTITSNTDPAPDTAGLLQFSFMLDASAFVVNVQTTASQFYVKVDGEYISLTPHSVTSTNGWVKFDFGSRNMRRIEIIGGQGVNALQFRGVAINPTASIYAAQVRGPRVICVGDNFTDNSISSWVHWFADAMEWDDVWASGVGGTGWLSDAGGTKKTFRQRLYTDIVPFQPDMVLVHGGVNDGGNTSQALFNEVAAFVNQLRAALPNCLIVGGCNVSKGVETLTSDVLTRRDVCKDGFTSAGGVWLDITEYPLAGVAASNTLAAALTAGRAGNGGTITTPIVGTGILCANTAGLRVGSTVDIGTGATRERKVLTGMVNSGGKPLFAFDGPLLYNHAAGEPVVEVGNSYVTGRGQAGAGATGGPNGVNGTTSWGNADIYCSSDSVHPTADGRKAIGMAQANIVSTFLNSLG